MNDFTEFLTAEFGRTPIPNPFDENTVMAILTVNGRAVIGGIAGLRSLSEMGIVDTGVEEAGLVPVYYPLMYAEVPVQNQDNPNYVKINPVFHKFFILLKTIDWQFLKCDSVFILRGDVTEDKSLVLEYEKAIKQIRSEDSNIQLVQQMPSQPPFPLKDGPKGSGYLKGL